MQPTILCPWDFKGAHNEHIKVATNTLAKVSTLDSSTVAITPTRTLTTGLAPKWVSAMQALMKPMNTNYVGPLFVGGMEVGEAYNAALQTIFSHDELKNYKYMLTWEDDVFPQPDALLQLIHVQQETDADIVSSVYWSKGEGGFPMIYGNVNDPEVNFRPVHPDKELYKWCYGTGMGFTLFKLDQFEKYFPGETEWFETASHYDAKKRKLEQATQDLFYMKKLVAAGGKICVAQHAKAGHYDSQMDVLW